jgi:hypothetical protein
VSRFSRFRLSPTRPWWSNAGMSADIVGAQRTATSAVVQAAETAAAAVTKAADDAKNKVEGKAPCPWCMGAIELPDI